MRDQKNNPKIKLGKTRSFIFRDFLGIVAGKYENDHIYGRLGRENDGK